MWPWPGLQDRRARVEDIASIVDALDLGPIDLVGHSMGAKHAARFTALYPQKVRRLALLEAGFGEPNSPNQAEYWGRVTRLFPPEGFETLAEYVEVAIEQFPRATRSILEESTGGFVHRTVWLALRAADVVVRKAWVRAAPPPSPTRLGTPRA
jgi:pimeloyl-ACP methyl ester carboxylesterase